uniref:Mucin 6, oligomeric mucus/gel-forming/pseudo n=1 Tax=Ailuropoda melanoleuca TaxID=9646 RepID=A0A7N5P3T3_AILME
TGDCRPLTLRPSPDKGWCSTWGAGHFSTFDGHVYDFPGTCNYVFAAICEDASPTFSVQLRRGPSGNISRIIVELGASVVTVQKAVISVKDVGVVSLPYTSNGLQITPFGQSVQLMAKQLQLELVVMWGPGSHLLVRTPAAREGWGSRRCPPAHPQVLVEKRHMGKLCGLCGDFNGKQTDEFLSKEGKLLEPHTYAALQTLDDPNEICTYTPHVREAAQTCTQLLTRVAPKCNVPKEPFVQSCQVDMAECAQPGQQDCSCATLSEYSRRCSMAGQAVSSWRGPGLCPVGPCPANQVYQECGEACIKTCSNPQHTCSSFCTFGCFCPKGMVLDDVSKNHTCVPVTQCPCTLSGVDYAPGEVVTAACQTCRCTMGHWTCAEQPCPRRCSLEGGSFVTTFDARPYRFHGTCTYILLQSPQLPDGGSLVASYDKSGYSHSETALAAVIYVSKEDKIVISRDEVLTNNGNAKRLPYKTRNITVFRQTSTHLQMTTAFGLELVIQLEPVFQVYVTVGPHFRGQTRGLCGTFNGDTTDDFMASTGIVEGTASLFVDSWRTGNCPASLERETDPCSMSQLNKLCAETHCSVLVRDGTAFERCHATVNPRPFYKRCVYQACNYEETLPHVCAALSDYARACATHGILLRGWRNSVDNCTTPCTGNQTFGYDIGACGRTCLSLSDHAAECHPSAVPVDGCNCPEGTYLNHKAQCVRKAQCPCVLDSNKFILADQSAMVNGVICYCVNGRVSCPGSAPFPAATCSAPKAFQSCGDSSENTFGAACAPTCQMLATGTPCVPTKCEPGCVCAKGLYENASGQCVPPEECPCEFAGVSYPRGAELHTDCKTCTCFRGKWTCWQSARCSSTCTLYGEGHVVTFDGQRFMFDGSCGYILTTDGCGANDSQPTFKVLTENVVCGKSGVTCSRAIKIFLGGLSVVLADRNYTVRGEDPQVRLRVSTGSLNLVLDVAIGGRYNLTLVWNKHMTVFIRITRATQDALCGLCGNYNGNMKDDFETRSNYVASSELEFVNSWKDSPLCGDASLALDPCSLNAFRRSWAERKCNIINGPTFAACHGQVYRLPYYEACVRDACGCDTSGDCECLCDAVAAYAKACLDKGVCVDWRTPDFCPVYCEFYNTHARGDGAHQYDQEANCTWHYQPCLCPEHPQSLPDTNTEGCYNCSRHEYFDQSTGTCVPCSKLLAPPRPHTHQPLAGAARPAHTSSQPPGSPLHRAVPLGAETPGDPSNLGQGSRSRKLISLPCVPLPSNPLPPSLATGQTQPAIPIHNETSSAPKPTVSHTPPTTGTPTSVTAMATATTIKRHTPLTSHSTPMPPGSATTHTTGPPTGTSFRTTTTRLSPSRPETTLSTHAAPSTTSSVTPTTHRVIKPTHPETPSSPSPATHPGSTSEPTHVPSTGTQPTHTTPPLTRTTHTPSSLNTAKTSTPRASSPSLPIHNETSSAPKTTVSYTPPTTGTPTSVTSTATATKRHTPLTSHSAPTPPGSTTTHTTGPPMGTSFRTTTTRLSPSHPETTLSTHAAPSTTSSVTPTTHRVITPTHPETPFPVSPATHPGSSSGRPHIPIPGTQPTHTTLSLTRTTHTPSSLSTAKTSTPRASSPSLPIHNETSSAPKTTVSYTPPTTGTPTSVTSTATATKRHTPLTSHSAPTPPGSTTTHTTGPPMGTSFRTTTTRLSPSRPETTLSTHAAPSTTSSVTPTTHRVITPTHPETPSSPSPATHLGSTSESPHIPSTGTQPTHTTPPLTWTTHTPSSLSTAKTSTSRISYPSVPIHHETSSAPKPTISHTPQATGTLTSVTATATSTATTSKQHTLLTSHSAPMLSVSTTAHTTGPPTGTSLRTTSTQPNTSRPETTLSTHAAPSTTSSVTPTTHRVITPTHNETPSSPSPATHPSSTSAPPHTPSTGTHPTHTTPPLTRTTHTPSSLSTAKTSTPRESSPSLPIHHETSSAPKPTIAHTSPTTGTPTSRHTPLTSHSAPTPPVSTTTHIPGPPTGTTLRTTSAKPTPSRPKTTLATHTVTSTTSSVTPTTHRVITPTHPETPSSPSPATHLGSTSESPHIPSTGTQPTHTTPPLTWTTHTPSSLSTAKTSTSRISYPSVPIHHETSSAPKPTISHTPQATGTLTSVTATATSTATTSKQHTLLTSHSAPTLSVSTTAHTTEPPTGTSLRTTSTQPNTSRPETTLSTHAAPSTTSSVTPTTHRVITPTHPETPSFPSLATHPRSTSPTHTTPPLTQTTHTPSSLSMAKTSTSREPYPSVSIHHETSSAPKPTVSYTPPTTGTPTSVTSTATASTIKRHTPLTSHPTPTPPVSTTAHTTGPPIGTSFRTTSAQPTPSRPETTLSTHAAPSTTSLVTPTTHRVITPTHPETPSSPSPATHPSSTSAPPHVPSTGTQPTHTTPPLTRTTHTPSSLSTAKTSTPRDIASVSSFISSPGSSTPTLSSVSSLPTHTFPPSTLPTTPTVHGTHVSLSSTSILPSLPRTTPSTPVSHTFSSHYTTLQSTSLTTQNPASSFFSSTVGMTAILTSPVTNLTTGQVSTARVPTTVIPASSTSFHGSSSLHTTGSLSTGAPSVSSPVPSPSSSELEEEVTYRGCTANVTVTRCEGFCASSASFNTHTNQVDTHCSCCHPLSSYQKQFVLPCSDPEAQGQQLVLTLHMFSSCACSPRRCGD